MTTAFLDTNVLIYTQLRDPRSERAYDLMRSSYVIGVQTLNEFANVARRKLHMEWSDIAEASSLLSAHAEQVVATEFEDHLKSLQLADRHQLSLYDALMLAITLRAGCTIFHSEDMHPGLIIDDRLTLNDPFA